MIVFAGAVAAAQVPPPVRPLGPVLATSTEPLAAVSQVRALSGGRVIVNDNTGRRVLMFDSTLKHFIVIADTTSRTANAYGPQPGGLIAHRGDSTLFVDPASLSMQLIDPNGRIVRTLASPPSSTVQNLIGGPFGTPGFDSQGRLVYRASIRMPFKSSPLPRGIGMSVLASPESALVVRFSLENRQLDTVATFQVPRTWFNTSRDENGRVTLSQTINPMPWTDDWAVLSDGTIAVVRGREYRVDFIHADGTMTSSSRMPFEWQRMTDEDKTAIIDSTRNGWEQFLAALTAKWQATNEGSKSVADTSRNGRRQRPQTDGSTLSSTTGRGAVAGSPADLYLPQGYVTLGEMPDYRPAFRQGAARGDADGNLWIRTSKMVNGGAVYDVVSNKGELKDRILIPPGRVVAGFGPGGIVYMGVLDGTIARLERARVGTR